MTTAPTSTLSSRSVAARSIALYVHASTQARQPGGQAGRSSVKRRGQAFGNGSRTAGASFIPRLNGSGTFAGQTLLQSPQAVHCSLTKAGEWVSVTCQPPSETAAFVTRQPVMTFTRGFRSSLRVLISMPQEGGQSLGK